LLLCSTLAAQIERATIVGTVTDNSGAAVPGVTVQVTHESTNPTVTLETDAAGKYTASNLVPGSYTIEAEKSGFNKHI
jgi:protocatechuate 3,4-dioxygenase beta subunit